MRPTHVRSRAGALVVAMLFAVALATACGGGSGSDDANGATPTRSDPNSPEFTLPNFSSVVVEDAFDVEIRRSAAYNADVRVDEAIFELLDIRVAEGVLTIGLTQEPVPGLGGDLREVTISMPSLDALDVNGASAADVSGFRSPGAIRVSAAGSSSVTGDLVAGTTLTVDASGSSSVTLDVVAVDVDLAAAGASTMTMRGTATSMRLRGTGASVFDLAGFGVATSAVSLDGASVATVQVNDLIDPVELDGASLLRYLGGAVLGDVSTAAGSTVEEIE